MLLRNSICLRLEMFASQTMDLSHIELSRSDNISSSRSVAKREHIESTQLTYRQKKKQEQAQQDFSFMLAFCYKWILRLPCPFSACKNAPRKAGQENYFKIQTFVIVLYPRSVELKAPLLFFSGVLGVCVSSTGKAPFSSAALVTNLKAY